MKNYLITIFILLAAWQGAVAEGENDTLWTKMIDGITDVKFSPDGKSIAVGRENGDVFLLNASNGEQIASFKNMRFVYEVSFSPDGKYLASASDGKSTVDVDSARILIWDIINNQIFLSLRDSIRKPLIHKVAITLAYSNEGKYLAAGFDVGSIEPQESVIIVWDASTWEEVYFQKEPIGIDKIKFSPGNKFLVTSFRNENSFIYYLKIQDTKTWDVLMPALQHPDMVRDFTFTSDGSKLITGCDDGNIRIWNTEIKELERILKVEGNIKSMGISNDNNYIFYQWKYGLRSGLFKKDMKNEEIVYKYNTDVFPEGRTSMNSIDVSPNQPYFVAGSSVGLCVYKSDLLSSINETEQLIETIYPNPTNGMLKINFYNPIYQFLRVELQNISGALIDTIFSGNLEQGEQSINYNGNDIFAGNYIITISAKGFSKSFKFIKEK